MTIPELVQLLRDTQTPEDREQLRAERDRWRKEGVLPSFLAGLEEVKEEQ